MIIIKPGVIPKTTKRFECDICGCIFECEKNEYKFHDSQKEDAWYESKCPTCQSVVITY